MMRTGGCLCGGIRYEIAAQQFVPWYCHCSLCRRWTGAATSAGIGVPGATFRLTAGEESIRTLRWEDRKDWVSCKRCGSSLFTAQQWPPQPATRVNVRLGTLDETGAELAPKVRIYVDSKAPWYALPDELPQFPEGTGG